MPIAPGKPFQRRPYEGEVILLGVRWYLRFPLSYTPVAEMRQERGLTLDRTCVWCWVQDYAPEIHRRCRPHRKPVGKSWRVDETSVKVKGQDRYLYWAVDSSGQTIEFLLTAKGDAAAQRFFRKALSASATPLPRVINGDRNPAYPAAVEPLQSEGTLRRSCRLRRCKLLNNVVEQDRRVPKQRVWLAKGYGSFCSAWRTLQGIEAVHLIQKGRARRVAKGDAVGQARFISKLFGLAAEHSSKIGPCRRFSHARIKSSQPNRPKNSTTVSAHHDAGRKSKLASFAVARIPPGRPSCGTRPMW